MTDLGNRILQLRKQKGLSQTELAEAVGITYAQIGRYETKGAQPSAEVLKKIADALDSSTDFLMYGDKNEKAQASIKDTELLQQFMEVELLPDDEKSTLFKVVSAYIRDFKTRKAYAM